MAGLESWKSRGVDNLQVFKANVELEANRGAILILRNGVVSTTSGVHIGTNIIRDGPGESQ